MCGTKNDLVAPMSRSAHNSILGYVTLHTAFCRISFNMTLCLTEWLASNCRYYKNGGEFWWREDPYLGPSYPDSGVGSDSRDPQEGFFKKNKIRKHDKRELKIRRRRRQRKCRWKSEFAFFQSSSQLLQVTDFVKCRRTLVEFLKTISKFRKREEISSSLVYFLCTSLN